MAGSVFPERRSAARRPWRARRCHRCRAEAEPLRSPPRRRLPCNDVEWSSRPRKISSRRRCGARRAAGPGPTGLVGYPLRRTRSLDPATPTHKFPPIGLMPPAERFAPSRMHCRLATGFRPRRLLRRGRPGFRPTRQNPGARYGPFPPDPSVNVSESSASLAGASSPSGARASIDKDAPRPQNISTLSSPEAPLFFFIKGRCSYNARCRPARPAHRGAPVIVAEGYVGRDVIPWLRPGFFFGRRTVRAARDARLTG